MKCPVCSVDLVMSERQGIEIDYCPECRGVWLDRGELDKIVERTNLSPKNSYPDEPRQEYSQHEKHKEYARYNSNEFQRKRKRGGFLGDLFDFGD